jgi:hypothetical protein
MVKLKELWELGLRIVRDHRRFFEELAEEEQIAGEVFRSYLVYAAAVPAIAAFVGNAIVGDKGVLAPAVPALLRSALFYGLMIGHVFLVAELLAYVSPYFELEPDFNRSFAFVAYALAPAFGAGAFYLLPVLRPFSLAGLYSLYLIYTYSPPVFRVRDEVSRPFAMAAVALTVATWFVLSLAFSVVAWS